MTLYSTVFLFCKCRPIIFFENEMNFKFSRSYFLIIKKITFIFAVVKMQALPNDSLEDFISIPPLFS